MAAVNDARTQLMDDFNKMASNAESLLRAMAAVPGEKVAALRASVEEVQATARQKVRDLQGMARDKAEAADTYVHENPWALIGAAAVVGFVLGVAIRRD
jgi:ElaB/YqjD/DUF883 family membrane-anchored ribosome-binding protein